MDFKSGLRKWLSGVDFDDVREWSISFDWSGAWGASPAKEGTAVSIQGCRFINLSAVQPRILDIHFQVLVEDGNFVWLKSRGAALPVEEPLDKHFAERFKRNAGSLPTPLTIPPGGMAEGAFGLLWDQDRIGTPGSIWQKVQGNAQLTVFEHRSQQKRMIRPGECYDAKLQRRYRGLAGYPFGGWRARFHKFRYGVRASLRLLSIALRKLS